MTERIVTPEGEDVYLRSLDPEIFEKAAERIIKEENFLACIALRRAIYSENEEGTKKERISHPYITAFTEFFCPRCGIGSSSVWWFSSRINGQELTRQNCMEARTFALLLMAEMTRDVKKRRKQK